jgi:hypothetical protein
MGDWLLTMDQDTGVSDHVVGKMLQCLDDYDRDDIGIICAKYADQNRYVEKNNKKYTELLVTITFGNLLNLKMYGKAGPFL